jgi:hypothetical protein
MFQAGTFRSRTIDIAMNTVRGFELSDLGICRMSRFRCESDLSSDISKWAEKTMTQKTGLSEESHEVRISLITFFMWKTTGFSTAESIFHEQFLLVLSAVIREN